MKYFFYRNTMSVFKILLLLIIAVTCVYASVNDIASVKKDLNYIKKSKNVTRESYRTVAEKFYAIYQKSPSQSESLYLSAETYYASYKRFNHSDDLANSLKYYRLIGANFGGKQGSDSYLKSAEIYQIMKDYASAKFMLNKLIAKFPRSPEAAEARKELAEIDKKFDKDDDSKVNSKAEENRSPKNSKGHNALLEEKGEHPAENTASGHSVKITNIKYWSNEDYTRVAIDLNGKVNFEKHWLKENQELQKPPRLFVDIYNSTISDAIAKEMSIQDGLLKSIRWGIYTKGVTRIVLDSENVKDFTVFQMDNPNRIIIDVSNDSIAKISTDSTAKEKEKDKDKDNKEKEKDKKHITGNKHTLAGVFGLKVKTIVIDPGHGGKDPGCTYHGLLEKDIVLDVGLMLKNMLESYDKNLTVLMTRDTDVFIPLEERTAFANKKRADLFVSIHVNASRNSEANGIETYVLNVTKDKAALEVAALENQASEKSLSDLQGILKDIMLNSKLEESILLAKLVQDKTVSSLSEKSLGVKQAPFYVLVGAKMPSILVETGFLSNRASAGRFSTTQYRKSIANGIFKGIMNYIEKYNGKG